VRCCAADVYAVAATVYAVAATVYAVATTLTCSTRGGSAKKGADDFSPPGERRWASEALGVVAEIHPPHQEQERCGQHLKHFNDGLGRGAGDATNRLLQHAHLRLSPSFEQHSGGEKWPAGQRDGRVLQKHCTKRVCHRSACRRVVQQCVGHERVFGLREGVHRGADRGVAGGRAAGRGLSSDLVGHRQRK